MSEHTRIKLKRRHQRPKYRDTRNSKLRNSKGGLWVDSYIKMPISHIVRYLQVNIGRPYNKIYSELVDKVKKSHIPVYMLNRLLKYLIVKKGEKASMNISFYLSNGILNLNKEKI